MVRLAFPDFDPQWIRRLQEQTQEQSRLLADAFRAPEPAQLMTATAADTIGSTLLALSRDTAVVVRDFDSQFRGLFADLEQINRGLAASNLFAGMEAAGDLLRDQARAFVAINEAMSAAAGDQWSRLQPLFAQVEAAAEAPDEATRASLVADALAALFESVTRIPLSFHTRRDKLKFAFCVIVFLWTLQTSFVGRAHEATQDASIRELRSRQQEQARAIAGLVELVRQLAEASRARPRCPSASTVVAFYALRLPAAQVASDVWRLATVFT